MQYLIMHGSFGSPEENWFRWLESQLLAKGHKVILKPFPVDDWNQLEAHGKENLDSFVPKQNLSAWEHVFKDNILTLVNSEPTYFIGHSLAPIFMLHMLQKYDFKLAGAIFVAPFFDIPDRPAIWQFYPVNKTFYSYDFDFAKIKSQITGKSYVIYGDNDQYVPATEPPLFAQKLGSKTIVVPGGKHCGSNFKEFPLVFELSQKNLS